MDRENPNELIKRSPEVVDYISDENTQSQRWKQLDSVDADIEMSRIGVWLGFQGVGLWGKLEEVVALPIEFAQVSVRPTQLLAWSLGVEQHGD